jgi:hypothetical protein
MNTNRNFVKFNETVKQSDKSEIKKTVLCSTLDKEPKVVYYNNQTLEDYIIKQKEW